MSWPLSLLVILALCLTKVECYKSSSEHYKSYHFDPYSYGYDVEDNYGNKQWKQEKSSNPMEVHGSYGYRDNNGLYREVTYVADKNGFRANIKSNEPGVTGTKDPASVHLDAHHSPIPQVPIHSTKHVSSGVPGYYKSQQAL